MKKLIKYDIINLLLIMITLMMLLLAINLYMINRNIITVNAYEKADTKAIDSNNFKKNLFLYMLNKSIPLMDLNDSSDIKINLVTLSKELIDKAFNFDYTNPKSYLGAQISMIREVENDLNIVSKYSIIDEDYDTRSIFVMKEQENSNTNNNLKDDIIIQEKEVDKPNNSLTKEELNEPRIEIVSTPVPAPEKISHDMDKPLILIYHTHGTESYKPERVGNYHSLNRQFTVIRVGEELKNKLEEKGYKVIHDDTLHDYPSYQGSYNRSLETLNKNLQKFNSLKIIFDIHRDGVDHIDSLDNYELFRENSYIEIDGKKVATYSMVVGGQNENVLQLKRFMYYLKGVSDELYPGLCSKIIEKPFKYNEYKSDYYALLEIGSNANTIEESINTAHYLSEVIYQALNGFVEKK